MTKVTQWWMLGLDSWRLGLEATSVMALRSARLAIGDAEAMAEARLMVAEKLNAAAEIQLGLMTGALGQTPHAISRNIVRSYSSKVRKNRRRLR